METDVPLPLDPPPAPPAPPQAPSAEPPAGDPPEQAPNLSVTDHEAANPVKARHRRARSHDAAPDDVPRINALTKKLRETEAQLAAAKQEPSTTSGAGGREGGVGTASATPPTPATVSLPAPVQPTFVAAAEEDPEPDPADYLNDTSKNYVKDQARWEARQAIREENHRVSAASSAAKEREYWIVRADDVKKVHADFEAVAYGPSPIPKDSMVDRFIRESAGGLHVLYHLHKHRDELASMLALPLFDPMTNRYPQIEALSQLALRLVPSNGRQAAAPTGSVAPPAPVTRQPRPPNPVRTGPQSVGNEPPGDNASVSEHESFWNKRARR